MSDVVCIGKVLLADCTSSCVQLEGKLLGDEAGSHLMMAVQQLCYAPLAKGCFALKPWHLVACAEPGRHI